MDYRLVLGLGAFLHEVAGDARLVCVFVCIITNIIIIWNLFLLPSLEQES